MNSYAGYRLGWNDGHSCMAHMLTADEFDKYVTGLFVLSQAIKSPAQAPPIKKVKYVNASDVPELVYWLDTNNVPISYGDSDLTLVGADVVLKWGEFPVTLETTLMDLSKMFINLEG